MQNGKRKMKIMNLHNLFIFLLLAITTLSGCGLQQIQRAHELQPPKVKVQAVGFGLPTGGGWPVSCILLLENPNPQTLSINGYDYELWLEGRRVVQGGSDRPVTLPALGQTTVEFPMMVKFPALLGLLPAGLKNPDHKFRYQLRGGVRLPIFIGSWRIPFNFKGEVAAGELQDRLQGLGLKGKLF
ncbi:MAG: LEA type 2 family protein [Deltaproteobacteria bacterium]|nr:LEA type 2 family protein [Deltaproteobacteria bacterium]